MLSVNLALLAVLACLFSTSISAQDACTLPTGASVVDVGTVSVGTYDSEAEYIWEVSCSNVDEGPLLTFTAFDMENKLDYVYVYGEPAADGTRFSAQLTGSETPAPIAVAVGEFLTVQLTSDGAVEGRGFSADLTCLSAGQLPPPPPPPPAGPCTTNENDGKLTHTLGHLW